ncbi:MAG: hypothetical protein IPQ09_18695 [Myxococcales bacterium]|nr:hypothetical protein [Myxococcales bacterium]
MPLPQAGSSTRKGEELRAHGEELVFGLGLADARAPRLHDRRPDHAHDVVVGGVVRAALVALGVVHDALKDAAEDVRIDVLPVRLGRLGERRELRLAEGHGDRLAEEPPVEERDRTLALAPTRSVACAHEPEQIGEALLHVAVAGALVEERGEVLLGEEPDVLREHREDALEAELDHVPLALRVLLLEAAVQLRDELGDLTGHLRDVDDGRRGAGHPGRREKREGLAVLGQIVDRDREPRRGAVTGEVVELQIALVREHHVLGHRVDLETHAEQVFPRVVEHDVVVHHLDEQAPRAPQERHAARRALPAVDHGELGRQGRLERLPAGPAEALEELRGEGARRIAPAKPARALEHEAAEVRLEGVVALWGGGRTLGARRAVLRRGALGGLSHDTEEAIDERGLVATARAVEGVADGLELARGQRFEDGAEGQRALADDGLDVGVGGPSVGPQGPIPGQSGSSARRGGRGRAA